MHLAAPSPPPPWYTPPTHVVEAALKATPSAPTVILTVTGPTDAGFTSYAVECETLSESVAINAWPLVVTAVAKGCTLVLDGPTPTRWVLPDAPAVTCTIADGCASNVSRSVEDAP